MPGLGWSSNRPRLTAEAGDERLHDGGNQKDKNEVSRSTACGMIFLRFGHGSSQGLNFGETFFPQIHGAGLLHCRDV